MRKVPIALVLLLVAGFLAVLWWNFSLSPVNIADTTPRQFTIQKGESLRDIANELHTKGLIRDQIAFFLLLKFLGIEKNIQAGTYRLAPSFTAQELAKKLTSGTEDLWITIPEGWRSEQILDYLSSINPAQWSIDDKIWHASEGKLFPDTYLVPKQMPLEKVRVLLTDNFATKYDNLLAKNGNTSGLNPDQVIVLASLIEREAKTNADRPIAAGVILNRLKAGMALDVDATVQYAIGYTHVSGWWPKNLTADDLKFKSPYNTYLNPGLPPAPICNPGLAAISAALNPAKTDYLYYISDKNGIMHYAKTLDEQNANIAKYLGP